MHARIQKVLQEGIQHLQRCFFVLLLVDEGREDPNITTLKGDHL